MDATIRSAEFVLGFVVGLLVALALAVAVFTAINWQFAIHFSDGV